MNKVLDTVLKLEIEKRIDELVRLGMNWRTDKGASKEEIRELAKRLAYEEFGVTP